MMHFYPKRNVISHILRNLMEMVLQFRAVVHCNIWEPLIIHTAQMIVKILCFCVKYMPAKVWFPWIKCYIAQGFKGALSCWSGFFSPSCSLSNVLLLGLDKYSDCSCSLSKKSTGYVTIKIQLFICIVFTYTSVKMDCGYICTHDIWWVSWGPSQGSCWHSHSKTYSHHCAVTVRYDHQCNKQCTIPYGFSVHGL